MTRKRVILISEKISVEKNLKNFLKGAHIVVVVWFVIGVLVGCVLTVILSRRKSVGSLRIDTSDPEDNPYLFLELSKDVGEVYRKKYITLRVNTKNFIPHK